MSTAWALPASGWPNIVIALAALCLAALINFSRATLYARGAAHFVLSSEAKHRLNRLPDPAVLNVGGVSKTTRVIFIRHGESTWNEFANRGAKPSALIALVTSVLYEILCFVTRRADSRFYDAPLCPHGVEQAMNLRRFLASAGAQKATGSKKVASDIEALRTRSARSVVVASNLRRAIATVVIALRERLESANADESVVLLSSLQEQSRNVDTLSVVEPDARNAMTGMGDKQRLAANFDTSRMGKQKGFFDKGYDKLQQFAVFATNEHAGGRVIVGGHSLWFRSFFRAYLPRSVPHGSLAEKAKLKKMINAGVVAFDLKQGTLPNGMPGFVIDADSLDVIYEGFCK